MGTELWHNLLYTLWLHKEAWLRRTCKAEGLGSSPCRYMHFGQFHHQFLMTPTFNTKMFTLSVQTALQKWCWHMLIWWNWQYTTKWCWHTKQPSENHTLVSPILRMCKKTCLFKLTSLPSSWASIRQRTISDTVITISSAWDAWVTVQNISSRTFLHLAVYMYVKTTRVMQEMRRCEINIIIYCNKLTPYYRKQHYFCPSIYRVRLASSPGLIFCVRNEWADGRAKNKAWYLL